MVSRITRLMLCALVLGLYPATMLTASAAPVAHHPMIGIGDDKSDMFSDPRFFALGIRTVRFDMHWDALSMPKFERPLVAWMKAAHAHNLDVLVTIDHTDKVLWKRVRVREKKHGHYVKANGHYVYVYKKEAFSQTRVLPSPAAYGAAFEAFHHRFPWVKNFATWDETNFTGEATFDKEELVSKYYRVLRHDCPSCTILAAEFLDVNRHYAVPMTTWARTFIRDLGYQPGYWGLNDYEDANHLVTTSTRQLLGAVKGKIWLAETGGIVNRRSTTSKQAGFTQDAAHAAKVDQYILKTIGSLSPRIQRIYLYEWDARTRHDSWDTALISYTGAPRAGYTVVAKTLFAWGVKPNCAISRVPPTCTGLGGGGQGSTGPTGPTGATG